MFEALIRFDVQLYTLIHGLRPSWDYLLGWPTYLGLGWILMIIVLILMMLWDPKNIGRKYGVVFFTILATEVLVLALKLMYRRPRPFMALRENADISVLFTEPSSFSFPSGHTAAIFCVAVLINLLYHHRFQWLYLAAIWVGITRIYVGVHYPSDVLVGGLVGAAVPVLAVKILRRFNRGLFWKVKERPDEAKT